MEKEINYNKKQAQKYGWNPSWFGCQFFNEELIRAISRFQRTNGLTADGMCGPSTYRVVWSDREQYLDGTIETVQYKQAIIYNGNEIPILWDKVITWNESGGKKASEGHYSSYAGKPPRKPRFFVSHWDVCLSSNSCYRVLEQRGISVHFGIDNDGTIYQWLDMQHAGWHAGGRSWNHNSVGVEISNAYYPKYQNWYKTNVGKERPIVTDAMCHGKRLPTFTGFYPEQLDALAALWEAVSFACDIPLKLPSTVDTVDRDCKQNEFSGFCNHYQLTSRKIDCAGLDNKLILEKAKELRGKR